MNLDSLCRKLSITNIRQDYHGALLDATLLSKVYLRLTTGKQENLNLNDIKYTKFNDTKNINHDKTIFLNPREQLMHLTNSEKAEHENFISKMKDPHGKKLIIFETYSQILSVVS